MPIFDINWELENFKFTDVGPRLRLNIMSAINVANWSRHFLVGLTFPSVNLKAHNY